MELKLVHERNLKSPVCDQTFITDKSLLVQMRNHAEMRSGRMQPPIPGMQNSIFSDSVCSLERFRLSLPVWSKTRRRSHRPGKQKALAEQNLPPKKRKLDSSVSDASDPNPANSDEIVNPSVIFSDGINDPEKLHVCDVCERCFKSYQALGGHKAHHNNNMKARKIPTSKNCEIYEECSEGGGFGCHRCPFCDKRFLKGQALGGHKRHCRRLQTRVLGFDLNELPPDWTTGYKV
ncbi:PREDICTED: zinc finger protein ZAT1-like [Erythranthe guttata]|nr:PREDICTED: zinc finger protein ZAT1-like [Erythranthe guttata]|eukprot:XP_012838140.1 PREDICTED: zinc finger protein ZAT1-like [Erythranthe guttata]